MSTQKTSKRPGAEGIGVDYRGAPVIDPTENVIALIDAASRRHDDIRAANNLFLQEKISCGKEMAILRAEHAKEMNTLESNRLNAIRQVDVLAVSTAADRAQAAIQALAATTLSNAENLRQLVTSTAATIAAQTSGTVAGLAERIAALEKSSYEGKGKQAVSDPMLTQLVDEMKSLRESRAGNTGKGEGGKQMWSYVAAGFGFLLVLLLIISTGLIIYSRMAAK